VNEWEKIEKAPLVSPENTRNVNSGIDPSLSGETKRQISVIFKILCQHVISVNETISINITAIFGYETGFLPFLPFCS